jgi:kumamolisin
MADGRTEIPGSVVKRPAAVRLVHPADPNETVDVTVVLRRPATAPTHGKTRDEIARSLAAPPEEISAITDFARRYGLDVLEASAAKRTVRLQGSAQKMNRAFGANLAYYAGPDGMFLSYDGPLSVESKIAPYVTAVLGLDRRPAASPRSSQR